MRGKVQPDGRLGWVLGWIETPVKISQLVEKLFGENPSPMRYALASIGHS